MPIDDCFDLTTTFVHCSSFHQEVPLYLPFLKSKKNAVTPRRLRFNQKEGKLGFRDERTHMKSPLRNAIKKALEGRSLAYRQVATIINDNRLYVPKDGWLVVDEQVRTCAKDNPRFFQVDREPKPHRIFRNS